MFVDELRRAVEASPRTELHTVSGLLWKAFAAGQVSEDEANPLVALIETRKAGCGALGAPHPRRLVGSRPRAPESLARRRRWAASGLLPPNVACRFTLGEQAALAIVAAENRKRGDCRLTHQEIADVAGVGVSTVKNAMRAARAIRLLAIEERRLAAFRNASNVVRIVDPSWLAWLRLGGGVKSVPRSPTPIKYPALAQRNRTWAAEGQGTGRAGPRRDSRRLLPMGGG